MCLLTHRATYAAGSASVNIPVACFITLNLRTVPCTVSLGQLNVFIGFKKKNNVN
jgi:hypothetical protein